MAPTLVSHGLSPRAALSAAKVSDMSVASMKLDLRSLEAPIYAASGGLRSYLKDLGISDRSEVAVSPFAVHELSRRQNVRPGGMAINKGAGTVSPEAVNNRIMFIMFGFLAAGLVITAIWFFFWAKNGGFRFKEGDWEEYKSTVLRRKGKDGKTLSNATASTELGGGSVAGEFDREEMLHVRMGRDDDVRQYRHEKPARVGGLNREPDGSYYDHTNSNRSEAITEAMTEEAPTGRTRGFFSRSSKRASSKPVARAPSTAYSFVQGDDSHADTLSYMDEASQYTPQRPSRHQPSSRSHHHHQQQQHRSHRSHQHQPSSRSPRKSQRDRSEPDMGSEPTSYGDGWTDDGAPANSDTGTKAYRHVIPGLSKGTRTEVTFSSDESGQRQKKSRGYRRAGGRRRDSLSDSEGG